MMIRRRGRSAIIATLTAVGVGFAVAGCAAGAAAGTGAGTATAEIAAVTGASTGPAATVRSAAAADSSSSAVADICLNLLAIDAVPAPDAGPAGGSATANKAFAAAVLPELQLAASSAPPALNAALVTLLPIVEAMGQGAALPLDDSGWTTAVAGYEAWAHSNCGFQPVELMAMDYEFDGAPSSLQPGPTSFTLMNHSERDEVHSAVLVKRHPDLQVGIANLFEVPLDRLGDYGDVLPGLVSADPGATGGMLVDLTPGHYFLICALQSDPDDPDSSHLLRGMLTEFEVA